MTLIESMWRDYATRDTPDDWHRLELMLWGTLIFAGGCPGLDIPDLHDLSDLARARARLAEEAV